MPLLDAGGADLWSAAAVHLPRRRAVITPDRGFVLGERGCRKRKLASKFPACSKGTVSACFAAKRSNAWKGH